MNRQKSTGKKSPPAWTDIRRKLAQTDMDYVIGIVKALFDFSKENRTFLVSRLFPETDWSALLEKCRKQVREAVFPDPPRQIRLGDARKAIRAYRKATSDLAGTAELMLVFVESGTDCGRGNQGQSPITERCQGATQRHFRLQIVDCRLAEGPAPDGERGRDDGDSRRLEAYSLGRMLRQKHTGAASREP